MRAGARHQRPRAVPRPGRPILRLHRRPHLLAASAAAIAAAVERVLPLDAASPDRLTRLAAAADTARQGASQGTIANPQPDSPSGDRRRP